MPALTSLTRTWFRPRLAEMATSRSAPTPSIPVLRSALGEASFTMRLSWKQKRTMPTIIRPMTSPQKAAPMPKKAMPDAVTAKVAMAAKRPFSSARAMRGGIGERRQQGKPGHQGDQFRGQNREEWPPRIRRKARKQDKTGHKTARSASALALSGWASSPVQMAAVIAARLVVLAPKKAEIVENSPVTATIGPAGGWSYPLALNTAMPGRFCEAMVTR